MKAENNSRYIQSKYYGENVFVPEMTTHGWDVFCGVCLGFDLAFKQFIVLRGNNSTVVTYQTEVFETKRDAWASIADMN